MSENIRRQALAEFLQSRRARLSPIEMGIVSSNRRRAQGLRREEVAQLAGVGLAWYTWLEQGRDIHVSDQVLQSVAHALRLNADETRHLFLLAQRQAPVSHDMKTSAVLSPAMERLLANQGVFPAFILGRYWDILAWNRSASLLFGGLEHMIDEERNHVWQMFANPGVRCFLLDWENHARRMIAEFRVSYSYFVEDAQFVALVERLCSASDLFRECWSRHDVVGRANVYKDFNHPQVGLLHFEQTTLLVSEQPDLRLVVKIPLPGTGTEDRLRILLETELLPKPIEQLALQDEDDG